MIPPPVVAPPSAVAPALSAITDMLDNATHSLVDYLAFTQMDPKTLCVADKLRLATVLEMLTQVSRTTEIESRILQVKPDPWSCESSNSTILRSPYPHAPNEQAASAAHYADNVKRPPLVQGKNPTLALDSRHAHSTTGTKPTSSLAPSHSLLPSPSVSEPLADSPSDSPQTYTHTTASTGNAEPSSHLLHSQKNSRSPWTRDEMLFFESQVAQHGNRFTAIWRKHGPSGSESNTLAKFSVSQLRRKWAAISRQRADLVARKLDDHLRRGSAASRVRTWEVR